MSQAILSRIDTANHPAPGRFVDVGGFNLHLSCTGQGSPIVVLDSGLRSPAASWVLVQNEVSKVTRVCSYDRAGYGFSDPGPLPRTSQKIAEELHVLLKNAGEIGPYILVGHSFGGLIARMFEQAYPHDVTGLVLVDSVAEQSLNSKLWMSIWQPYNNDAYALWAARIIARLGLGRIVSPDIFKDTSFSSDEQSAIKAVMLFTNSILATIDEFHTFVQSLNEAKNLCGPLENKLLTVIEAGKIKDNDFFPFSGTKNEIQTMKQEWSSYQKNLAELSLQSTYLVAKDSGHRIPYEKPDIIINAVKRMIGE